MDPTSHVTEKVPLLFHNKFCRIIDPLFSVTSPVARINIRIGHGVMVPLIAQVSRKYMIKTTSLIIRMAVWKEKKVFQKP